jgi:hypothetical protein
LLLLLEKAFGLQGSVHNGLGDAHTALVGARSSSILGSSNPKLYFGKNNLGKFSPLAAQKPRENVRKRKKERRNRSVFGTQEHGMV